jgi:peptidoglycan/LPS O-acetylase OafA/YrhL
VNRRIAYIDGLRAVAVLLVVLDHAMQHGLGRASGGQLEAALRRILAEGSHGVDLFFVLSGFCLAHPTLSALRRDGGASLDACKYFAKRIVRIVPPYYAAIAVILALTGPGIAGIADVAKQALFLDRGTTFINGSFWTLCVEFRWYFIFPLALALWVRNARAFLATAIAATLMFWFTRAHDVDLGTLLPFMLGIVAADLSLRPGGAHERLAKYLLLAGVLLGVVLERVTSMPTQFGVEQMSAFIQTNAGWQIAMFGLVLAAGGNPALRALLSARLPVFIGIASYSIYLVHEPVVAFVDARVGGVAAQCAVSLAAAVLAGAVFWAAFERPWTQGILKRRALDAVHAAVVPAFLWLHLPMRVALGAPATQMPELVKPLEPAGAA